MINATEAAAVLGVKVETVYAYVSRGRLTAHRAGGGRHSYFDPADVDDLAKRGRQAPAARPELHIESAITLIADGHYWYRGRDPIELAMSGTCSFEQVAEFLWTGEMSEAPIRWPLDDEVVAAGRRVQEVLGKGELTFERLRLVAGAAASADKLRFDLRPQAVRATARRLIASIVASLPRARGATIARRAASHLGRRDAEPAIEAVLILMADHELAASTLAARVAASYRADPHAVVAAGLATLSGARGTAPHRSPPRCCSPTSPPTATPAL